MRSTGSAGVLIQTVDMLGYVGTLAALCIVEKVEGGNGHQQHAHEAAAPPPPHALAHAISHAHHGDADATAAAAAAGSIRAAIDRLSDDGWERSRGGMDLAVERPKALTLLQLDMHSISAVEPRSLVTPTGVTPSAEGDDAMQLLQLVEGFFYSLGPIAALCALASLLYWSSALKDARRETAD